MSENGDTVQVALRIRPLVVSEITRGCQLCLDCVPKEPQVQVRGTERAFTYNFVFGPDDSQLHFYETAVKDLVQHLFKGYNVTILAYGQTGSGKTYSMGTCYSGVDDNIGVIPRAINDIFHEVQVMNDWDFKITVSFMELYQEQLFDLLAPNRSIVDIREDGRGIKVPGLTEIPVESAEATIKCLIQGSSGRATGATAMNAQSSRSHAIFTITIHQQQKNNVSMAMTSKFHLVDLAGSERPKKTKATGERFKEGVNINRGLLALGNVISALGDESQKGFISYRDSKLTRLLQDSLGGNSLTLMLACVSPADYNLDETMSTLRYADRARRIRNKPVVNQDPKSAEVARLKQEVQDLRLELLAHNGTADCPQQHKKLEDDCANLIAKNRKLTEALNNAFTENTNLVERALLAELARDRMNVKLCELHAEYGQAMESLNQTVVDHTTGPTTCPTTCPASFYEQLQTLRDLQLKIQDLQAEQKRSAEEILNHELSNGISPNFRAESAVDDNQSQTQVDIDERHEIHTMQQAELNRELQELNRALALKEELAAQLATNKNQFVNIRTDYEGNVKDLEQQIVILQTEKIELVQSLKDMQNSTISSKSSEINRKKLADLEQKITSLTKKISEQNRVIKMKDVSDQKITRLFNEIQNMKQTKVRLIKQMKSESEQFRNWKLQRERELCKLRDQDRKRQNQIVRMERLHTKQQNVLKRKVEEAVAINKRLKDALTVQKSAQDRRLHQGSSTKVQMWLAQELEVLVRTVDAERTLEQLMEDRAVLNEQLAHLEVRFGDQLSSDDKVETEREIHQLKDDLSLRSAQIADLQQKILDSDQENKTKTRWDTIQSMVDAKCALKYLFELAAELKRDTSNKDFRLEELEAAVIKGEKSVEQLGQQYKESTLAHEQEILQLEKEHQDKVYVLLRQLPFVEEGSCCDSKLIERLNFQEAELEKMDALRTELINATQELKELKHQLKKSTHRKYRNTYNTDGEDEDDVIKDPDWHGTPLYKRILKLKDDKSLNPPKEQEQKHKTKVAVKRNSDGEVKCACKGQKCSTKRCSCRKLGAQCSSICKCNALECVNQIQVQRSLFMDETSPDEEKKPTDSFKRPRILTPLENLTFKDDVQTSRFFK